MNTPKTMHSKQKARTDASDADARNAGSRRALQSSASVTKADGLDRQRLIAEAAYYRAEKRGFEPGHELEDWLSAEAAVTSVSLDVSSHVHKN